MPNYWLLKTEPSAYSYDRLEGDGRAAWDASRWCRSRRCSGRSCWPWADARESPPAVERQADRVVQELATAVVGLVGFVLIAEDHLPRSRQHLPPRDRRHPVVVAPQDLRGAQLDQA